MIIYLKSRDKAIPSGMIIRNVRHVVTKALKMTACQGRRERKAGRDLGKGTVPEKQERENAFHSIKTFENLETAANGTEIFRKLLNLRNANYPTENSRNSRSKLEWKENLREKFWENLGIPREIVLFFGNFGKCCSIRHCKLPKIQTARFG